MEIIHGMLINRKVNKLIVFETNLEMNIRNNLNQATHFSFSK